MALVNHAKGEINSKIVYYGPEFSGKETNLNFIYRKLKPEHRGQLKAMNVEESKMLFFDFTPAGQGKIGDYDVRFHVYSIVGEVKGETAWKMLLKGADGIVFVADSAPSRMGANEKSLDELRKIARSYGMSIKDLPGVLQCNKRDMDAPAPLDKMVEELNYGGFTVVPAVAGKGEGVLESLFALMKGVLKNIKESGIVPGVEEEEPEAHVTAVPPPEEQQASKVEPPAVAEIAVNEPPVQYPGEVEEAVTASITSEPLQGEETAVSKEPSIEISGPPEALYGGRLRIPIKLRCGDQVKEVSVTLTVTAELS